MAIEIEQLKKKIKELANTIFALNIGFSPDVDRLKAENAEMLGVLRDITYLAERYGVNERYGKIILEARAVLTKYTKVGI